MQRIISLATVLAALTASPLLYTTSVYAATCGGTNTQLINCDGQSGAPAINELIRIAVVAITIVIGVVAVGGIAYASVLYASARDSEAQVDQAKTIIRNIIIGLLLYVLMIAIVNWLIPGGVIR
jgi:uncharacterized membrane protein YjgN (DUF898 family)